MRSHWPVRLVVASTLASCVFTGVPATARTGTRPVDSTAPDVVPGAQLPAARVRHYRMSGAVRPLLFWIGRDDIGLARITWRRGSNGTYGYELLVGTDPALAPRSLNRWGYIAEEALGPADGSVLAMMSGSHDTSYDEEAASVARPPAKGDVRAIRASLQNGAATWQVASVQTPVALTIRDVDAALERVRQDTARTAPRQARVAPGFRPGFLTAVSELIDGAVQASSDPARAHVGPGARVEYIFGGDLYELQLRAAEPLVASYAGRPTPAVRTSFEIRTLATGARTRFDVTSATRGDMAGVPLSMEWQPRWWLRVRLDLDEPGRPQ